MKGQGKGGESRLCNIPVFNVASGDVNMTLCVFCAFLRLLFFLLETDLPQKGAKGAKRGRKLSGSFYRRLRILRPGRSGSSGPEGMAQIGREQE
jgi:hypothetical protein